MQPDAISQTFRQYFVEIALFDAPSQYRIQTERVLAALGCIERFFENITDDLPIVATENVHDGDIVKTLAKLSDGTIGQQNQPAVFESILQGLSHFRRVWHQIAGFCPDGLKFR